MIAKLAGLLDAVLPDGCVVDVGGVGYLVFCSGKTLARLPAPGEAVQLAVITHVREDHIHLYGFIDQAEREWFRLLTTVQGVGAKVALGILSALTPADLGQAIALQDKAALTRAEGVGPKLAARLLTELKDKTAGIVLAPALAASRAAAAGGAPLAGAADDAVSALVNLGYRRVEAFNAVATAQKRLGAEAALDALIRAGLQELAA
ncbi:MAG: Holliday junction branch migration protein RuvA [Alphaproteobacteria bacterium]